MKSSQTQTGNSGSVRESVSNKTWDSGIGAVLDSKIVFVDFGDNGCKSCSVVHGLSTESLHERQKKGMSAFTGGHDRLSGGLSENDWSESEFFSHD